MRKPLKVQARFRHAPTYKRLTNAERLTDAAIIRDGEVHFGGKSHAQVRAKMGDKDIYDHKPGDEEGFMTSTRRFVTRDEAVPIGQAAGQVSDRFYGRDLLSSDINW